MHLIVIGFGLFFWFSLVFVGGLGSDWFNASVTLTGLLCVVTGIAVWLKASKETTLVLCCFTAFLYLPAIYMNFVAESGVNWVGLVFDGVFVFMLYALVKVQPNKSLKDVDALKRAP